MIKTLFKKKFETKAELVEAMQFISTARSYVRWAFGLQFVAILLLFAWNNTGYGPKIDFPSSLMLIIAMSSWFFNKRLKSLSGYVEPELLGFVLEAKQIESLQTWSVAHETLKQMLPSVEPAHYENLTSGQRNTLLKVLNPIEKPILLKPLLASIRRCAGQEAIPFLEAFFEKSKKHKSVEIRQLGAIAHEILPEVRIRVARALISERLEAETATTTELLEEHRDIGQSQSSS